MSEIVNKKRYDLEDRTLKFAQNVVFYVNKLPKTLPNIEICKQLVRSAGSVGANYIEANEALSKKDFIMRIKISRKESKETNYWLQLTEVASTYAKDRESLIKEAIELMKIFGAILIKSGT